MQDLSMSETLVVEEEDGQRRELHTIAIFMVPELGPRQFLVTADYDDMAVEIHEVCEDDLGYVLNPIPIDDWDAVLASWAEMAAQLDTEIEGDAECNN